LDWLREQPLRWGTISANDLELFRVTDDVEEVVECIREHYAARRAQGAHETP